MLSKKDYIRAARLVRDAFTHTEINEKNLVIEAFAAFFEEDNPRFDRERFIAACNEFS